jgi:tetratricopeptide (TPR) repeat protein
MTTETTWASKLDLRAYLSREPVILALLSALAVALFLGVSGLSRIFHGQQDSLGTRWFARGVRDLKARRFAPAVEEFRTALLYSRDNASYQLNLAEALIGLQRTDEAYAYLVNLWDREPENGLVNLELARIASQKGETERALRYYHNAIYATWPGDGQTERRETRLELIKLLLSIKDHPQAQSELIALAANLAGSPSEEARVGELFLQAQDYEHALEQYRLSLKSDHRNPEALAGAGRAAFELGRYPLAQRYLQAAVSASPSDTQSAAQLRTADLVLQLDPFQRQISVRQRNQIVTEAFNAAGQRLKSCPAPLGAEAPAAQAPPENLAEQWGKMKSQITAGGLRRNPDLVEKAMDLVFEIERRTSTTCTPPAGADLALLLVAKLHEGN